MFVYRKKFGFTLIELTVVMAVLGLVALTTANMLNGSRVVTSLDCQQQAQQLAHCLRTARNTAVTSGQAVRLVAVTSGRNVTGYRTEAGAAGWQSVQAEQAFPATLQITWSVPDIAFLPTGMTDRSLQIEIRSADSGWNVDVLSASGGVVLTKQ